MRCQTYEITFVGQAGTALCAEFDDCAITIGPGTTTLRAQLPDQGALMGLLQASGWPDNQSCRNLAAWSWAGDGDGDRHLVVVNLSGQPTQARIPLDWPDLPGRSWRLTDILGPSVFKRDGGELASPGLFVDRGPWQFHLLALQ